VPAPCAGGGFDRSYQLEDHDRNFNPKRLLEDDRPLPPVQPNSGYYTATAFADHVIAYLKEHSEHHASQPFFAYLAFTTHRIFRVTRRLRISRVTATDTLLVGMPFGPKDSAASDNSDWLLFLSPTEPDLRAPSGAPGVEKQSGRVKWLTRCRGMG